MKRWGILIVVVLMLSACAGLPVPQLPAPAPPAPVVEPPATRPVTVAVRSAGQPIVGADVTLDDRPTPHRATTDAQGVAHFAAVAASLRDTHVWVMAAGYLVHDAHADLTAERGDIEVELQPVPVEPPAPQVPPVPVVPKTVRGRLRAEGRRLVYADGSPFVWRGATGFLVTEQAIRGRDADARAFLAWAKRTGFTVVRVLAMLPGGWEDGHAFTPEEGLAALPRVFALAEEADLYVQLTVLNNTRELPTGDLGALVERAGVACAAAPACAVLEVANEPYHGVQREDVHDPANLARWAARVPAGVLVALGPASDDESPTMAAGSVITAHLDRSRDPWNMVRRVRELGLVSATTGKPVLNTEPDGFAEVGCVPRLVGCYKRQTDPSLAFAFGVLGRIFNVPTTFHFEDGLRASVPGPVQQAAAEAFIAGSRVVPDDVGWLSFQNADDDLRKAWPQSPVVRFRAADGEPKPNAAVRVYSGIAGSRGWTVALGVQGDPGIEWGRGWAPAALVAERPGVRVWEIRR